MARVHARRANASLNDLPVLALEVWRTAPTHVAIGALNAFYAFPVGAEKLAGARPIDVERTKHGSDPPNSPNRNAM